MIFHGNMMMAARALRLAARLLPEDEDLAGRRPGQPADAAPVPREADERPRPAEGKGDREARHAHR